MSKPKAQVFAVENELGRLAREPGGRTIDQALRQAEQRIEAVRDVSIASLAEKADQLAALAAATRADNAPGGFGDLYDLSNSIFGVAASFGLKPLAEAALSLCDLADNYRNGEPANWPAVDVHVDGIRLLAMLGQRAGAAVAEPILEGLRKVRARVLPAT